MVGGLIGIRYAKALISLAGNDEANIDRIGKEIGEIASIYGEEQTLRDFMSDPKLNKEKKIAFIKEWLDGSECTETIDKFCRYVSSQNRFSLIPEISRAYQRLADEKLGRASASITVAFKMTDEEEADIQKKLSDITDKKISLSVDVDPSIVGGAVTTIGSLVFDGSIKNRLKLISESISRGN